MRRAIDPSDRRSPWLVCLDLQPDATEAPPADLPRRLGLCRQIVHHARAAGWSVVHVLRRPGAPRDRHELGAAPPYPGLEPSPFETVFFRQHLSAFSLPQFEQIALSARDAEAFTVAVSLSPACLLTAFDAHERGLRMSLVEDTMASPRIDPFDAETVRGVLLGMAGQYLRCVSVAALLGLATEAGTRHAANQH